MKTLRFVTLLFFTGFLFLSSCNRNKKDDNQEKDQSFETTWYEQYGISDYKLDWSISDYSYALQVLSGLKIKYPYSLPRLHSRESGALFEKLVSEENFSFLDDSITLKNKAKTLLRFSHIYDNLSDLYYMPQAPTQYYKRELVEIYLFGLKLSQHMLNTGRQIELAHDPSLDVFKAGLFQVRDSYIVLIDKTIEITGKTNAYLEKDLVRLAESIHASIQQNLFWMNPSQKKIIVDALNKVIHKTPSSKIKQSYNSILEKL